MRTEDSANGKFRIIYPDLDVWVQEKNVVKIETIGSATEKAKYKDIYFSLRVGNASPLSEKSYKTTLIDVDLILDENKELYFDISDILRTVPLGKGLAFDTIELYDTEDEQIDEITDAFTIGFNAKGLVNPAHTLPPMTDELSHLINDYNPLIYPSDGAFFMPNKMIKGYKKENGYIAVEHYGIAPIDGEPLYLFLDDYSEGSFEYSESGASFLADSGGRPAYNVVVATFDDDRPGTIYYQRTLLERNCERTYALVRWVSFTGQTRQHVFELRNHKMTASSVELESVAHDYNILKSRTDSATLYLDELTAYDVWYYGDVALSSRVDVSLDGGNTFRRVKVTTKEVAPQNGDAGQLSKLSINFDFAEYDAIIL